VTDVFPNPFNPRTRIAFSVPRAADVTMRVFDLSGRVVAAPIQGRSYAAGEYTVVWEATDRFGRELPSGTYVLLVEAGAESCSRKLSLVR
jgi:hypothetical protein